VITWATRGAAVMEFCGQRLGQVTKSTAGQRHSLIQPSNATHHTACTLAILRPVLARSIEIQPSDWNLPSELDFGTAQDEVLPSRRDTFAPPRMLAS
jgi:hypothetical protein